VPADEETAGLFVTHDRMAFAHLGEDAVGIFAEDGIERRQLQYVRRRGSLGRGRIVSHRSSSRAAS
jgi:hypothetical protein